MMEERKGKYDPIGVTRDNSKNNETSTSTLKDDEGCSAGFCWQTVGIFWKQATWFGRLQVRVNQRGWTVSRKVAIVAVVAVVGFKVRSR